MSIATEPLRAETLKREDLDPARATEMFELLNACFEGVTREQFEKDLEEKNRIILLTRGDCLFGFSTLLTYSSFFRGERVNVLYSGDTIVAPEAWGSSALPRAWIAAVNSMGHDLPPGRYVWMLLSSGFRTYRFLPVFWREFYPCYQRPAPGEWQDLLRHLAAERFASRFDPEAGRVRFEFPQRLRLGLRDIPEERLSDPHVAYFAKKNPGYAEGDELVCLTELSEKNLTAAGRRMLRGHGN